MPLIGGFLPLPAVKLYKYKSSDGKFCRGSFLLNYQEKEELKLLNLK